MNNKQSAAQVTGPLCSATHRSSDHVRQRGNKSGRFRRMAYLLAAALFIPAGITGIAIAVLYDPTLADMSAISGLVRYVDTKEYNTRRDDDNLFYLFLQGDSRLYRYQGDYPSYKELESKLRPGTEVTIWIARSALEHTDATAIWQVEINDEMVVSFQQLKTAQQDEWRYGGLGGGTFLLLGLWMVVCCFAKRTSP